VRRFGAGDRRDAGLLFARFVFVAAMMTLDEARDWCATNGVTILEDLEARRLTLMLFGTEVSASADLPDDSTETWQAVFRRLAGNLRLRAQLKERSRAYLMAKRAGGAPHLAPAPGAGGAAGAAGAPASAAGRARPDRGGRQATRRR
jgi:hypothetical protein